MLFKLRLKLIELVVGKTPVMLNSVITDGCLQVYGFGFYKNNRIG